MEAELAVLVFAHTRALTLSEPIGHQLWLPTFAVLIQVLLLACVPTLLGAFIDDLPAFRVNSRVVGELLLLLSLLCLLSFLLTPQKLLLPALKVIQFCLR